MIWDSTYWKDDLAKTAETLKRRSTQTRWVERSFVNLEKDVFIAFYSIRKLIEAKKLTDETVNITFKLQTYLPTGKNVTLINWHKIDELYNMEKKSSEQRKLGFICDQIIHSYIFIPTFDSDNTLHSILFSSDHQRSNKLFQMRVNELVDCISQVANDDITDSIHAFNKDTGDYDVELH